MHFFSVPLTHFIEISSCGDYVAAMNLAKRHRRGLFRPLLGRLLAGVFAVQVVLTGFCLLSNDAHAMPMAQTNTSQVKEMAEHCSKAATHEQGHHADGCFHCDDQNLFVKAAPIDFPASSFSFVLLIAMPEFPQWTASEAIPVGLMPTGPPRSTTLLYTTTQRIRV